MRRIVYKGLLSLPGKTFSVGSGLVGALGTFAPEFVKKQTDLAMTPENIRVIGIALLAVAFVYVLLLWLLKPGEDGASDTAINQTTSGHSAHAIVNHGTVNIGAVPSPVPQIQPARGPIVRQLSQIEIDIARAATNPAGLARIVAKPKADLPLAGLLVRVYHALGPSPEPGPERKKFWTRVNLAIADKVVGEELHSWGRIGQRALSPIELNDWQNGTFNHRDGGSLLVPVAYSSGYEVTDLHFYKPEIDRIWPQPPRTKDDEKH